MRRILATAMIAVSAGSCTAIIPSTRELAYESQLFSGTQEVSLRWSREEMPLRIYVDPADPLYPHTITAIQRWTDALNYGEFRGIIVTDSTSAEIIVRNMSPDEVPGGDPGEGGTPLMRIPAFAPQCNGETQIDIDVVELEVHLPMRIYIWPNGTPASAALATCYRITSTHELGHALGILQHSTSTSDVMYRNPVLDGVSEADRETFELLFHTLPTLTIVRNDP